MFLFLDTETTGKDPEDRLIQLAYIFGDTQVNELFKPPLPIKIGAMATHHITEKMVADKELFSKSEVKQNLQALLSGGAILVAHNAKFDIDMLEKEGVYVPQYIDTLKIARYIDEPDCESHTLQYLRYFYGIEVEADAHDAMGDVVVLQGIFEMLVDELRYKDCLETHAETTKRMLELSLLPTKFKKFNFGKYVGATIEEVKAGGFDGKGIEWMTWLLAEKRKTPENETDWIFTLEEALK